MEKFKGNLNPCSQFAELKIEEKTVENDLSTKECVSNNENKSGENEYSKTESVQNIDENSTEHSQNEKLLTVTINHKLRKLRRRARQRFERK